jgi:shikimate kinase
VSGPHLVLIGMMGAGKSTVGRLLADRLGRPFLDSDGVIEAETGRTVAQIFADDGEAAFRAVETDVLTQMLDGGEAAVIAAAGGSVLDPANRAHMRARGTVVWLRVDLAHLTERVKSGAHRPLLDDDPAATLARLADEREVLYRESAHEIVDVDELSPTEVADLVLASTGAAA